MRQLDRSPTPSPFTSRWQAPGFVALILFLLALPPIASVLHLDSPQNRFLEMESRYRFAHGLVHEETGDLDVLFLGTCLFLSGLDMPTFQQALSKSLGRPTKVAMLATTFAGEDFEYVMLRDFLQKRSTKLLVVGMPGGKSFHDAPHALAPYWARFSDVKDLSVGISTPHAIRLYAMSVLGSPRHLLGLFRNESAKWGEEKDLMGMDPAYFCMDHAPFEPLAPDHSKLALRDWAYSPNSKQGPRFEFTHDGIPPYRRQAFARIVELAKQHSIPIANLQILTPKDWQSPNVQSYENWSEYFGYPIEMIGVPPADYFAGLDEAKRNCLFWDVEHPNKNGADYFSKIIAPTLARTYAKLTQQKR
jgi:hypothetical protein